MSLMLEPPPIASPPARRTDELTEAGVLRAYRASRRAALSCHGSDAEVEHLCHRYWKAEAALRALVRRKTGNRSRKRAMAALVDGKLVVALPDDTLRVGQECTYILDAPRA